MRCVGAMLMALGGCSLLVQPGESTEDAGPSGDASLADSGATSCWQTRMQLSFVQDGSTPLEGFPLLVRLSTYDLRDLDVDWQTPAKLRFSDQDGNPIPFEIDSHDGAEVRVWVKVRVRPAPEETVLLVHGGNPVAGPGGRAREVWSNGYRAVYHLQESFATVPETIEDASEHENHGDSLDIDAKEGPILGPIGLGVGFGQSGDVIEISDAESLDVSSAITLEAWVRPPAEAVAGQQYALVKEGAYSLASHHSDAAHPDPTPRFQLSFEGADLTVRGAALEEDDAWTALAATYDADAASPEMRFYANGTSNTQAVVEGANISTSTADLVLGRGFVGALDEVRVSSVARSDDWIALQHRNVTGELSLTVENVEREEWCP